MFMARVVPIVTPAAVVFMNVARGNYFVAAFGDGAVEHSYWFICLLV